MLQPDEISNGPGSGVQEVIRLWGQRRRDWWRRRRRVALISIVAVGLGAIGLLAVPVISSQPDEPMVTSAWIAVPAGPFTAGPDPSVVWTGTDFLVFPRGRVDGGADGGNESSLVGGRFNTSAMAWTALTMPTDGAPTDVVWTGSEVVGLGRLADGTLAFWSFNPVESVWRRLPTPPVAPDTAASMIWSGRAVLIWGGRDHLPHEPAQFASYDPVAQSWIALEPGPLSARQFHTATWTGTDMLIVGGTDLVGADMADGAAYDPETGEWRLLPPMSEGRAGHRAVWSGRELVVVGGSVGSSRAETYTPPRTEWGDIDGLPWTIDGTAAVEGLSGRVAVIGGDAAPTGQVGYSLNPAAQSTAAFEWFLGARCDAGVGTSNDAILVIGGRHCGAGGTGEEQSWFRDGALASSLRLGW